MFRTSWPGLGQSSPSLVGLLKLTSGDASLSSLSSELPSSSDLSDCSLFSCSSSEISASDGSFSNEESESLSSGTVSSMSSQNLFFN